ncbi:MAG: hypothetical protein WBA33_15370 [Rhodanobacter lindaniclasticus]
MTAVEVDGFTASNWLHAPYYFPASSSALSLQLQSEPAHQNQVLLSRYFLAVDPVLDFDRGQHTNFVDFILVRKRGPAAICTAHTTSWGEPRANSRSMKSTIRKSL